MNLEKMKCGSCGNETVTLKAEKSRNGFSAIEATCSKCSSATIFKLSQPVIEAFFESNSDGIMCIGWGDEK